MKIEAEPRFEKSVMLLIDAKGAWSGIEFNRVADRDEFVRRINAGQAALERETTDPNLLRFKQIDGSAAKLEEIGVPVVDWEQRRWELAARFYVHWRGSNWTPINCINSADSFIAEFRKETKS